jgi:hypothetical protein
LSFSLSIISFNNLILILLSPFIPFLYRFLVFNYSTNICSCHYF